LVSFIKIINQDKLYILIPHIQTLARDANSHVRQYICDVIAAVVPLVGKDVSLPKLFPFLLELIEDKEPDVRISCLRSLVKFAEVLGSELMNSISPHFKNLMDDKKWRVREALYSSLVELAAHFGNADLFAKHIEPLFFQYLKDKASVIRDLGVSKIPTLIQTFKNDWFFNNCVPKLTETLNKQNGYLYRITALSSLRAAAAHLSNDAVSDKVLPILIKNAKDEVPNVRFVVIKILKSLAVKLDNSTINSYIKPLFQELSNDSDKDVAFYAQEALANL